MTSCAVHFDVIYHQFSIFEDMVRRQPCQILLILLLLLLPIAGTFSNQMDVKLMTGEVSRSFESNRCEASGGSLSLTGHESGQPIQKSKECRKDVSKVSHVVGSKKRSDQVSLL